MTALQNLWSRLPEAVRRELLIGTEGSVHLMELAQRTLLAGQDQQQDQALLLTLGADFLAEAWAKDPLNGQLAGQVLSLHQRWPFLDQTVHGLAVAVQKHWTPPGDARYYKRLMLERDASKLKNFLMVQVELEPQNLYWRRQTLVFARYEEDWGLAGDIALGHAWPDGLDPVRKVLQGDLAWLQGRFDEARTCYAKGFGLDARFRLAVLTSRAEGLDQARTLWRDLFQDAPWLTSAILVCHDLLREVGAQRNAVEGTGVVALYSYNKAGELDVTLASALKSDLGETPIWVLNNGSTDETSSVLAAWRDRVGERLRVIALPVNVGAPAARNWLLHEAQKSGCRWMAYVDDDVELPTDWLQSLGAAMRLYPDAGVWGCKVVDAAAPAVLQSVDLHLVPPDGQDGQDNRFKVSDLHHQTHDYGQFDYLRPCASVTGCCHLFRLEQLEQVGGFDLRFSPSQYDDLEHDVRLNLAERYAVYQGHLRILHMKRTGKSTQTDSAQFGSALANMHKLQKKYTQADYQRLMDWEAAVLTRDFWRKQQIVARWLGDGR